ncbi:MAG: hypothetical protein AB7I37_17695 [Pirellulales bacterium]
MSATQWIATGIRINEHGRLVIDAEPEYGNRKKWDGEMEFYLAPGVSSQLREAVEGHNTKESMVEIAAAEIKEFVEDFKADYHKKRKTLAEQLNLDVKDIPTPSWWGMDDAERDVTIAK